MVLLFCTLILLTPVHRTLVTGYINRDKLLLNVHKQHNNITGKVNNEKFKRSLARFQAPTYSDRFIGTFSVE